MACQPGMEECSQNVKEIHYVLNSLTGQVDDFT